MSYDYKKFTAVAAVTIALLILVSICFSVVNQYVDTGDNGKITTEAALYGEVSDSIQTQGFAVREEEVINLDYSGVLNYRVANGSRVSAGGIIADVFLSESDAAAQNLADRLEREIRSLSSLSKPMDYFLSASASTGDQIYDSLTGILMDVQQNDFSGVSVLKENLLFSLSRKQVISGEESAEDYAQRVSELEQEKEQLITGSGKAVGSVEAPQAGYFINAADGLEKVEDIKKIKNITAARTEELLSMSSGENISSSVGKICSDFKWYLACLFDDEAMIKFEGVEDVTLDIPFASTATIPAKIIATNRDAKTGKTAMVLECSYMDADLAMIRNETIQVNVKTYSGVLVNERALRFCDIEYEEEDGNGGTIKKVKKNVKGIYVLYGGQLDFVQIFSEKDVNGYAVCKTELSEAEEKNLVTERTVQLYDQVVVGGVDLYDGKIVK